MAFQSLYVKQKIVGCYRLHEQLEKNKIIRDPSFYGPNGVLSSSSIDVPEVD